MANTLKTSRGARRACFITGALPNGHGTLLTRHLHALRAALREVQRRHRFRVDAFVVLPDHLHAVCSSRSSEAEPALFCREVAEAFTRHAARESQPDIPLRLHWHNASGHDEDLPRLIDHIHLDPVHHGLATRAAFWPWSSYARHVQSAAAVAGRRLMGTEPMPLCCDVADHGSRHALSCR